MGEARKDALRLDFDRKLKLEFHGTKVTSDAGLLAYRELDDALGLTSAIDSELRDNRTGKNTRHSIAALLRQSIYSRLAGYDDTNDAERLCVDPAIRHVAGGRAIERSAASTSAISVSPTYGNQEGTAYNGYFQCTCYHPLFCFNQYGDLERALLRNGNVHSADDWRSLLEPIVNRYRGYDILRFFRGDAAFADPNIYGYLEAEGYFYAIRLKGNQILYGKVEHLLTRPVGRPPKKPIVLYHSFRYQAASWNIARRVVAKIEWHAGKLFPRVGFIVTNLRWKSSNVVRFYNKRGTAEQWIKEGKYALKWTRLSCHDFVDNQVRLQLFALAYNLGNFLRRLALPKCVKKWSLRTLREKLIKIGAKVVSHSRYVIFQMAEVAVSQTLFREILARIQQLRFLAIPARPG